MPLSVNSKLKDVLAHPEGKALMEKYVPGMTSDPRMQQGMSMTIRAIAPFTSGKLAGNNLKALDEELKKLS